MDLNKVIIKNYRQYRDIVIDFARDSNENFTVIKGNNGTGKTTLLNALSWCLYGEEIHDYKDDSSMSICNNKSLKLAENNSDILVCVEMEFIDENDEILSFRRSRKFHKTNDDLIADAFGDTFEVITQDGDDFVITEDNAVYIVESRIPKDIEDYFFFDGARLSEYFQNTSNKKIKDAVLELSQLNLILTLNNNLKNVEERYIKKQKDIAPVLGRANEEISNLNSQVNIYETSLETSKNKLKEFSNELKIVEEELMKSNVNEVSEKSKRDKELKRRIKKAKSNVNSAKEKRRKLILETYPYMLSYNYFTHFLKYGESTRKKGFIPPKFKRGFLEDMLKEGICICGADLKTDTAHRKAIEALLEETNPLTDKSEEITLAIAHVKEVILKDLKSFKADLKEYKQIIAENEADLDEMIEERKTIRAFLEKYSEDRIKELTSLKTSYEKEIRNHERNMGRCESEISSIRKKIGKWKKVQTQEAKMQIELEEYNKKINFTRNAIDAAKTVRSELTENMRLKIENLTKEKFIKIQWKDDEFVDIRLDQNYGVFVKNRTGKEERPGDLSDGEKLCLGLCFMSALHNVSGFELPIVMDTPLGNLDVDMRHNIAEFLPQFVGGKQIVLLVTSTEYTDDFRETLLDHVGKEYTIEWNNSEDGKESRVVLDG
ncbi:AAA family ATPase [uncultured Methanobrevibacter sp.]|uniref:AAA family ATPase n=1 Tax=uncultured Methanobrevibacter sp. TaxID=253161 RepID=UPI0025F7DE48|nr:AAA family ATPase [uncultured Methanobrevibacter sp.]